MIEHPFIAQARELLGAPHVLTQDLEAYAVDWKDKYHGRPLVVVRPGNTAEVSALVKLCVQHRLSIVPQGGNTGMCGAATPDDSGLQVVITLGRLNNIRAVDPANNTMTVEAGCLLHTLQETAESVNRLYPLSVGSEGSCQIGGNIATNAGGVQVLRYGNTRDLVLGLEVVLPSGEVLDMLRGLRKDNTGYDLRDLFVGSEGTLGVITAATMKLFPLPAASLTAWAAVPSMEQAVELLGLAHRYLGAGLTGFEVMNQFALSLVDRHFPHLRVPLFRDTPWCVLLENSDSESEAHARTRFEALLEEAMDQGLVTDAVVAESLSQARNLWHIRESITLAQAEEGLNIKHDISVPISAIPAFVKETDALLAQHIPGVRMVDFGHLGDGNLHYNVQTPEGGDAAAFLRQYEPQVNKIVYDAVSRHGGSISAEHGVGSLKVDSLPKYKDPVALGLMSRIKHALDPQGLLNPGRVIRTH
ncbi:MAG: FAD-binding oxidoreductase [Betaproteobacteria bacterium]|nr:FAD-binding oxidoreductase [Betaproteobacteria bacterium]